MDLRLCTAIAERRLLMFGYGGMVRVVEPHAYGRSAAGDEILSAWMRPGWSRTDPEGGWRMYRVDAMELVQMLPETFDGPRPDFNAADPNVAEVLCQLAGVPPRGGDAADDARAATDDAG